MKSLILQGIGHSEIQNYFDSMYQLVHTLNLVETDLGVKFTSRKKNHTIATFIANDQDLYIARLTDVRANYQFNSTSKLRLSIIHNNLSFNANNYINEIDDNFKSLGEQIVYSYRFNALSAFYLGFSSNAVETNQLGKLVQKY